MAQSAVLVNSLGVVISTIIIKSKAYEKVRIYFRRFYNMAWP